MFKAKIGKFTIEQLPNGNIYYEHETLGDERSAQVEIHNGEIIDVDGDICVPVGVLAVLLAENFISAEGFKIAVEGCYTKE